jgi:hypothetical protein
MRLLPAPEVRDHLARPVVAVVPDLSQMARSGASVTTANTRRRAGQSVGVVELTVGEESGVCSDSGAVELQLDLAVEVNA